MARKSANPRATQLKISINFSFSKLGKHINKIIDNTVEREKHAVVKVSKKTITDFDLPKLSDATIDKREDGYSDYFKKRGKDSHGGRRPMPTYEQRPLYYTKALYDSIKVEKKAVKKLAPYAKMV